MELGQRPPEELRLLLQWGEADKTTPFENAERCAKLMPHAVFETRPECSHSDWFGRYCEDTTARIRDFFGAE